VRPILFLSLFLLFTSFVEGLDPSKKIIQYGHQIYQSEQGLPQNSVTAMTQTRDGYIWIGTQGGLARFDGVRFITYDIKNSALKNNDVLGLAEDREGGLWIGTYGGGLAYLKDGKIRTFGTKEGMSSTTIRCLFYDHDGNLWIGTRSGGLNRFADGKFTTFTSRDGLISDSIYEIEETGEGIWIGTDHGLNLFQNGKFKSFTTADGLPHNTVRSLFADSSHNLWIGTDAGLTLRRDQAFRKTFTTADGLSNGTIRAIRQDHDGNLWIGTDGGLNRLQNGHFESFTSANDLSHDSVNTLFEDREGNLWIGTDGGGVNQLKDVNFTNSFVEKNRDNTVYSVIEDRSKNLWIGTRTNGLISTRDGINKVYPTDRPPLTGPIFALFAEPNGSLWIGTRGSGITLFNNGTFTPFEANEQLSNGTIRSIFQDRDHNTWIGTNSGLNLWKDEKLTAFTKKDGLTDNFIYCTIQDHSGNLWVGTFTGLTIYRDGKFSTVPNAGILNEQSIWALYEDRNGALWIATYGAGIFRYKDGKFTSFNSKQGLFDDAILSIVEDDQGYLWMSSYRGVFCVRKKELEDFAEGKIKSIHSIAFDSSDGMRSTECIGGVQPSGWKSKDGMLHFPTTKGLTTINPRKIKRNTIPPPVRIEQLICNGATLIGLTQLSNPLSFPPGEGNLEFGYTALSFVAPSKVKFRYKLDGYDKHWIEAATRRVAYYTKIPPGHYMFQIKAANNDGLWNENGASIKIYLKPHFYQTWYFYSLCVLAFGGLILAGHRFRVRQLRTQFSAVLEERNRISREIHDTLTQDFTGVVLQLEAAEMTLKENVETARECVDRAKEIARNGLVESRRFVRALRPAALERDQLAKALSQMAKRTVSGSGIDVNCSVIGMERILVPEVEDNLLRIAQEALNNIVKHSGAKESHVQLSYGLLHLVLKIEDNGHGFDLDNSSPNAEHGYGLVGMKERAVRVAGKLKMYSEIGKGTRIHVTVPLNRRTLA
jgi:ligand-binding sensor domain-containing protein/signal transduction histidine kinase